MSANNFTNYYHFESAATSVRVDRDKGIIYGVSLITSGITAKGHDLEVDGTTLDQMLACAEAKAKIPVKWNHKTGADAVSGYLKNFRIDGRKLVGDWHLLKSHERYAHALELASEMPECLGLSTSFKGADEVVVGGRKFARCTELVSADLVASPAANPDGFFEEKVDSRVKGMADNNQSNNGAANQAAEEKEFSLKDVMAGINAINDRINGIEGKVTSFEAFQDELVRNFADPDEDEDEDADAGDDGDDDGDDDLDDVQSRRGGRGYRGPQEFANGDEALQYLSEKLAGIEDAKEQAKVERAFEAYDAKVEGLLELNEQLALENQAMAEALTEFSDQTGQVVEFSAGQEGGYQHQISETHENGRKLTEFEARCKELEADGKSVTEAIKLAQKDDPKCYTRHLQEIGVLARTL